MGPLGSSILCAVACALQSLGALQRFAGNCTGALRQATRSRLACWGKESHICSVRPAILGAHHHRELHLLPNKRLCARCVTAVQIHVLAIHLLRRLAGEEAPALLLVPHLHCACEGLPRLRAKPELLSLDTFRTHCRGEKNILSYVDGLGPSDRTLQEKDVLAKHVTHGLAAHETKAFFRNERLDHATKDPAVNGTSPHPGALLRPSALESPHIRTAFAWQYTALAASG
mmetsp:Transcript_165536/g.293162  ORF Transcript_165536/g.293162 Transcript_165536/m.293162 type:complete len:229 (-) Transcript_165536:584-1270(-)